MTTWQLLTSKPRWYIIIASWLALVTIGIVDELSGHFIQLELFYLAPISVVSWYGNRANAVATATIGALVASIADRPLVITPSQLAITFWNAIVQLGFFIFVALVLSKLKDQTLELRELASQDALTRVANRRSCFQSLEVEINRCVRFGSVFSVAYLDLDNFKELNDRLGHDVGDNFLRQFAGTIRRNTRNIDTIARLGGDEFVIVLPETDLSKAKTALTKIQRLLTQLVKKQRWAVTFSIGVATFSECPDSVEKILSIADHIMYSVKRKGKNNIAFESWRPAKRKRT